MLASFEHLSDALASNIIRVFWWNFPNSFFSEKMKIEIFYKENDNKN